MESFLVISEKKLLFAFSFTVKSSSGKVNYYFFLKLDLPRDRGTPFAFVCFPCFTFLEKHSVYLLIFVKEFGAPPSGVRLDILVKED